MKVDMTKVLLKQLYSVKAEQYCLYYTGKCNFIQVVVILSVIKPRYISARILRWPAV